MKFFCESCFCRSCAYTHGESNTPFGLPAQLTFTGIRNYLYGPGEVRDGVTVLQLDVCTMQFRALKLYVIQDHSIFKILQQQRIDG
jgi:hypothetical protein